MKKHNLVFYLGLAWHFFPPDYFTYKNKSMYIMTTE